MLGKRVRIGMLGEFEASYALESGAVRPLEITAAKPRQVLALLAVNAGSTVGIDMLIDELWPFGPPSTVKTVLQTYVYQLRKLFVKSCCSREGAELLVTKTSGYALAVPRYNIDVFQFEHLVNAGNTALNYSQEKRAADLLEKALNLWRGPIPPDIRSGPSLGGFFVYLEERRIAALSKRIEADLAISRYHEVIGELKSLVTNHRLHEPFHIQLMRALYLSGRRGEALAAYRNLRHVLNDELGIEPSPEARNLQRNILVGREDG